MRRFLLLVGAIGGYLVAVRPWLLRLGATPAEASESLPGDALLESVDTQSTMAATIAAPPEQVWPWLVQMGCDRAGWYSWDRLDNAGRPSAEAIVPQWQDLAEGDRLASTPSGATYFTAAVVDPPHALVLRADLDLRGRPIEPDGPEPPHASHSTWAIVLRPTGDGATRLVVRTRSTGSPAWYRWVTNALVWEPAHAVMQHRQLRNLRRRAEGLGAPPAGAGPERGQGV